jgi:hypothetical protein
MLEVKLAVDLIVRAPFSTQSSSAGAVGVHSPLARTKGQPYIAGTLMKGRLRQSWRELRSAAGDAFPCDETQLLGEETGSVAGKAGVSVEPRRGLLRFSDFVLARTSSGPIPEYHITRIQMNPDLGSVQKGSYQVIETPLPSGAKLRFAGTIRYFANSNQEAEQIRDLVEKGLRWTTSVGAERTTGFGRLLEVTVTPTVELLSVQALAPQKSLPTFDLVLGFSQTFCVAKRRISDNLFQSDHVIPGGVLKGAVASTWTTLCGQSGKVVYEGLDPGRAELCRHFDKVRFTHALPSVAGQPSRPVAAPLSTAKAGAAIHDVLLMEKPELIDGHAPSFSTDWKPAVCEQIERDFGWPKRATEMRVRTKISEDGRRAEDAMLFAYEMIEPAGLEWHTKVDLSRVPEHDRSKTASQLLSLLASGIHGLGKTKISATVKGEGHVARSIGTRPLETGLYAIALQTPAVLCDPQPLERASGNGELHKAYAQAWTDLSAGSLKLVRYFARQSLAGGFYLHRRFRDGELYMPWLLTDAGSVFLLRDEGGAAEQLVLQWEQAGLPLPSWAVERYSRGELSGAHWSNCPYIPENGYGEIAVNLAVHQERRP